MTNAAFKLEDSGFSREQVDALSEFMDGSVATKADIAELSGEIKAQGERLDGKITAEITELSSEIKEVRGELKAQGERLDGKITAEIAELSGEIKAQGERLDGEIKAIRTELSGEIKEVRGELKADIAGLNGRINLIYWMLGVSVAGVISLVIKAFASS